MKKLILLPFVALFALGCESKLHEYATDPPTKHADYLTYITVAKIGGDDTIYYYSWEVLQFNPYMNAFPKWNTMHLEPWDVEVLYWTELPDDPFGSSFEATSGTIRPPDK